MKEIKISNLCTIDDIQGSVQGIQGTIESIKNRTDDVDKKSIQLENDVLGIFEGIQRRIDNDEKNINIIGDKLTNIVNTTVEKIGSYNGIQSSLKEERNKEIKNGIQRKIDDHYKNCEQDFKNLNGNFESVDGSVIKEISAIDGTDVNVVGYPKIDTSKSGNEIKLTFNFLKGYPGRQGIVGEDGDIGPIGDRGEDGDIGPQGDKGHQGSMGPKGIKGKSVTGTSGSFKGYQGVQGVQGLKGDIGDNGKCDLSEYAFLNREDNNWTAYQIFEDGAGDSGSDIRFKTNIRPTQSVLDDVLKLDVIDYIWDKEGEEKRDTFGISAQQLEELGGNFKKMVHDRGDENKTKWVEYDRFGVLAIKTIQEQQMKLNDILEKISTLKTKI